MNVSVNGEPVPETTGNARAVDPELGPALQEIAELKAKIARYENGILWGTTCERCATVLDSAYLETVRAEKAEATVTRLLALFDKPDSRGMRFAVVMDGTLKRIAGEAAESVTPGPETSPAASGDSGTASTGSTP